MEYIIPELYTIVQFYLVMFSVGIICGLLALLFFGWK